jgi:hypothetical protein
MKHIDPNRLERIHARFFRFVDKKTDAPCWIWTGAQAGGRLPHQRYGVFRPTWSRGERPQDYAHRVSFILHHGPIPPGLNILHRCDRSLCVYPEHIFAGTQAENANDMMMKNRSTFGSRSTFAKLRECDIPVVRNMHKAGSTHQEIADLYAVSRPTISLIIEGKTWKRTR